MIKRFKKFFSVILASGLSCALLISGCAVVPVGVETKSFYQSQTEQRVENGGVATLSDLDEPAGSGEAQSPDLTENVNWFLRTDAQIYCNSTYNSQQTDQPGTDSQQIVYITAGGGKDAYVKVYASEDEDYSDPIKEYSLAETEGFRYALPAKDLAAGEYTVALFPAKGASTPRVCEQFTITEGAVYTAKTQYRQNEEIVFSFYADTVNRGDGDYCWLGLYKKQDRESYGNDFLKWVTLCGNQLISGQGYILQENSVGSVGWSTTYPTKATNTESIMPAGDYELVLFGDGGYDNVLSKAEFSVLPGKTGKAEAPADVRFSIDDIQSGVLSGTMLCSFAPDRFNASEIVAYWANEDGILAEYLPFCAQRVTGNPQRCYAFENIMIPQGATNLRFYGKNAEGQGNTYFRVDLPEGCVFNAGEVLSEFTLLSDIHVGYTNYKLVDGEAKGTEVIANSNNFKKVLDDVKNVSGENSDGVFIVGDVTESGRLEEWVLVQSFVREKGMEDSIYYMLGNHDYYGVYTRGDWQQGTDFATAVKPFTDWTAQKAASENGSFTVSENGLWYEAVAGGYHHLVLNTEGSDGDWVTAHLSRQQLSWLNSRLDALSAENKPVFVYIHQPLTGTTAGTLPGEGWDHVKIKGEDGSLTRDISPLKEILDAHPNAFFISGHNHREVDSLRGVFLASTSQHTNFIQTGGTAYISKDTTPSENLRHEGWYVRVYEDKVVFLGREFTTGKWLAGACLVFDF